MDKAKVTLGDILRAFEDAYMAGWRAAIVRAEYGDDPETAFKEWIEEEIELLGLEPPRE
jgi:hypothetical protein